MSAIRYLLFSAVAACTFVHSGDLATMLRAQEPPAPVHLDLSPVGSRTNMSPRVEYGAYMPVDLGYGLSTEIFRDPAPPRPDIFHPTFGLKVPRFLHSHPDDPDRHIGKGGPLQGTSWLNRPYHADWLVGNRFNAADLANGVRQRDSLFGGYRIGRDFDHYWGREVEFSFTRPQIESAAGTGYVALNRDWGLNATLLYYPWGDARWRPYARWGLGFEHMRFNDEDGVGFNEFLLTMPLGGGVKYYVDRWLAFRLDLTDHIAFGSGGIASAHQVALTFGIEAHFGGPRRRYR